MKRKKQPHQPIKIVLLLAVILPLALVILFNSFGRKEFSLPHRLAFEILGAGQALATQSLGFCENIWRHYFSLVGVSRENEQLRQELRKYKGVSAEYREALATNVRLSQLLDFEQSFELPVLTAQIIGRDSSLWFKSMTVNKGSSAGVVKGMPVLALEGVVGQVVNVSPHYAKILLATDPNSAIDAIVQKSRAQGIIKGNGHAYQLHYVLKNNTVEKGSYIVTSGMGGIFPKGLPLGRISEVIASKRGMFHEVMVEPAVNFRELEYVTILLKTDSLAD